MNFSELLSKTWSSAVQDNATFNRWEDNKITTEECIEEFKNNNVLDKRLVINKVEFERWLNSLGYKR